MCDERLEYLSLCGMCHTLVVEEEEEELEPTKTRFINRFLSPYVCDTVENGKTNQITSRTCHRRVQMYGSLAMQLLYRHTGPWNANKRLLRGVVWRQSVLWWAWGFVFLVCQSA